LLSAGPALGADASPRTDLQGDPLPAEAVARMGSGRLRQERMLAFAFSPDGKSLVSAGRGGLRVWDAATGKLLRRIPVEGYGGFTFTFTPEGAVVAEAPFQGGETLKPTAGAVRVFDLASGKVVRRAKLQTEEKYFSTLALSPDGKRLACATTGPVLVFDTATGREALRVSLAGGGRAWGLTFAPDGRSLAARDFDTVRICDATNGKEVRALPPVADYVTHVRFSPDGRWLVTTTWDKKGQRPGPCSLWEAATGKERHRLKGTAGPVQSAAFSPDGKYLALGCQQGGLALWDVAALKEVRRLASAGSFGGPTFSPDGKTLAAGVGWGGAICLWDVATGRLLPASPDPALDMVTDLRFSADGRRLLGSAPMPIVWGPVTGREARRYPAPPPASVFCRLSPDESLIAAGDGSDIRLSDARTGKEMRRLKGHAKEVWGAFFLAGGRLASRGSDGECRVWDLASGRQLHRLNIGDRWARMAPSPDGRVLATATDLLGPGGAYEVVLWDLAAGREKLRLPLGEEQSASQVAFSADGRLVAASLSYPGRGGAGPILVWDAATGREVRFFKGRQTWAQSMAFTPDGRALATGSFDGGLRLWELASGRRRHTFVGHEGQMLSVAFSPDGRLLAAASSDAPVFVWDVTGAYGPRRPAPTAAELGRCWDELASADAEAAFRAVRRLAASPGEAVPFLRGRLKPVPPVPPERVRRLLADLDGADFATRRRAETELKGLADVVASELRKALEKGPSAEVQRELRRALEGLGKPTPERLRAVRAVEALEWAATPEAARLLGELAKGAPGATLTAEAAAARDRLRKGAGRRGEAER
ncbi:MAG TPA: WD40 repeat domain-containing protein, partial [Gemmataceae bacterium]|nr:WD40 repeat domain-containing protein [Gemmataceae bacterium]